MEIKKKYNSLTGTYEYYNIIIHEWVKSFSSKSEALSSQLPVAKSEGGGLFDSLTSIASKVASKVTSDTAKKLAETTAKQALESASKTAGDELGSRTAKYAVNRLMPEKIIPKSPSSVIGATAPKSVAVAAVDPDMIVKELQKMGEPKQSRRKALYRRGGIKRIFKKYNI